jgi:predicted nucleotidyltransferase
VNPAEHLRALARQIVEAALEHVPLRGAMLTGSAGRGDADFYSDIDLLLYVDDLPSEEVLREIRVVVGGTNRLSRDRSDHFCGEEFNIRGVRTEVSFFTVTRIESRLDDLCDRPEELDPLLQKVLSGMLYGLPLYGADLIGPWQERLRAYPEPLRRATIERCWNFFPLWYYGEAIDARDAELWRLDVLLEAAFNLLGVISALNRIYFSRFELKRMRALVSEMKVAPPHLAERIESLFRIDPAAAATELGHLVDETRALVAVELPDLELPLRFPPGIRQEPWVARGLRAEPGSARRER